MPNTPFHARTALLLSLAAAFGIAFMNVVAAAQ